MLRPPLAAVVLILPWPPSAVRALLLLAALGMMMLLAALGMMLLLLASSSSSLSLLRLVPSVTPLLSAYVGSGVLPVLEPGLDPCLDRSDVWP